MVELVPCEDMGRWDSLVEAQPGVTVFHRRAWLELVERIARAHLRACLITHNGETVGVLPFFVFRRGPFRIAASPPPQAATPVLGPAVREETLLGDVFEAFAREARRCGAGYCELRLSGDCAPVVWQRAGFEREARSTFVLDLTPGPERIWKERLAASCRRAVRKAEAAGLRVEEADLQGFVDRYHSLAAGVYARYHRPPPLGRSDYLALGETAARGGCVRVLAVYHGDEIVAAGIFPFGNGTVYYLDGVSDPAAQAMRPNNLLHWTLIRWACEAGLQRYDMVGAGIPGVARFKRTFGPEEVPCTYCFRSLNISAALARRLYAALAPVARAARLRFGRLGGRDTP